MNLIQRLRMLHRFWRYRLHTESSDLNFIHKHKLVGDLALDIGANKGIYSYWLHKWKNPQGQIYAFEPQPELQTHLIALKQQFELKDLTIFPYGLSNVPSNMALYRDKIGSGSATLIDMAIEGWEKVFVELKTLDAIGSDFPPVSFIKCDVEGHEYEVFKGAENILRRQLPVLLFECSHDIAQNGVLFKYLESLGYKGIFITKREIVPVSEFSRHPYSKVGIDRRNYFFLSQERLTAINGK